MNLPASLTVNSKIRIVSPAGKIKEDHVLPAVNWLKKQGFNVELGAHIFAEEFQFAGTDMQRLEDLQTAFDDPETDVIVCSRGGYGIVRIVDQLDFSAFKKHPKWLVGFSDVTVLHLCLNNLGYASIHGAMPPFFMKDNGEANQNLISLLDLLKGKKVNYQLAPVAQNKAGKASGELIGGNLSILTSLLGTPYEIETDGKLLFIEEIDEYLYHIDRMVQQLKLAGKLEKLAGIVVGDFTRIKDNDSPFGQAVEEIILNAVEDYGFPVCFGFEAGHDTVNLALAFGKCWELKVTNTKVDFHIQS